jgi:hypothetical protein
MKDQHRATAEQWLAMEVDGRNFAVASCLLELRDRIKALEAATAAKPNCPEIPDSSLLSRVAAVIDNGGACDREPEHIARDAIRAIADWLRKHYGGPTATTYVLEEEAKR